jgi:hypothetical protein
MVLQLRMTDNAKFDEEREMSLEDGLHGWMEDRNWWVHVTTWRRFRWDHRMTWMLKAWGPVAGPVLDVEGVEVGQ